MTKIIALLILYSLSLFSTFIPKSAIAQSCPEEELHIGEKPSEITRRVKLPKFGVEISVPENYRVMLRNSGEVEILHPQDYALWRCNMEGRGYGRGYYSEYIRLITRNPQLSLEAQIQKEYPQAEITRYSQGSLSGYIVINKDGLILPEFIGNHPTVKNKLINIYTNCDCDVELTDLTDLLSILDLATITPER